MNNNAKHTILSLLGKYLLSRLAISPFTVFYRPTATEWYLKFQPQSHAIPSRKRFDRAVRHT
ncbi:hypothetical protein BDZ89DRAFT_1059810 [Hymenopellis radicata]|nr:hypothetical protein BDZ89DRAFT_1059810 [Hymenopellis radicata]